MIKANSVKAEDAKPRVYSLNRGQDSRVAVIRVRYIVPVLATPEQGLFFIFNDPNL